MKRTKIVLNISAFISFIFGALYCFSLVFIPIGIYCFLAGKRFSYKADHLYDMYTVDNKILKNYIIFVCIVCFPLGLITLIAYYDLISNNVKVSGFSVETNEAETETSDEDDVQPKDENVETDEEKMEKYNKLKTFKEKGIITDEELEMARVQLFGEDENK